LDALVDTPLGAYSTAPSISLPIGAGGITIASNGNTPVAITAVVLTTMVTDTTALASLTTPSYAKYSTPGFATAVADGDLKWRFDGGTLKVVDEGFAGPADLKAIFTIPGVALASGGVSLTTPDFNIGIITGR
jgi:hypothetical protein